MARIPKRPLPQFSFWCPGCECWVGLVYRNRPKLDGMTGRLGNKRRMVLECEKCGCVHAERKRIATSRPKPETREPCTACGEVEYQAHGSCARCQVMARRKRLGVQKGQCTDCQGPLPYGEEIGMCRSCAESQWGSK